MANDKPTAHTVEDVIAGANKAGYRIGNFYQMPRTDKVTGEKVYIWNANIIGKLHGKYEIFDYGVDRDPVRALKKALKKALDGDVLLRLPDRKG